MQDNAMRSIVKAISYRVIGTVVTILISLVIIGDIRFAVTIGIFDLIMKTLAYYGHERIWNKIEFGKTKEPEFHI